MPFESTHLTFDEYRRTVRELRRIRLASDLMLAPVKALSRALAKLVKIR